MSMRIALFVFPLFFECDALRLPNIDVTPTYVDFESPEYEVENATAEWDAFVAETNSKLNARASLDAATTETKGEERGKKAERPINHEFCEGGRALPDLFLLGQQKAGTTTLAADLFLSGLGFLLPGKKEPHIFDQTCGFKHGIDLQTFLNESLEETCDTESRKWATFQKFQKFPSCGSGATFMDATPLNFRLPGFPKMLKQLYGEERSKKLKFIIALRDPMERYISGLFQRDGPQLNLHGKQPSQVVDLLEQNYVNIQKTDIARSYLADQFYRTLYGANLSPWLDSFDGSQFFIVPMDPYFPSLDARKNTLNQIAKHFDLDMHTENIIETKHMNKKSHPSFGKVLTPKNINFLLSKFHEDTELLAKNIAERNVTMSGYHGAPDKEAITKYLQSNYKNM